MRNVEVVGEASDGAEAVRKAVELKPDLILLDIGLPKLNGIEVARQVRELAPQSRIIFLSQESSPDIIQEALRSGGLGYITKIMAGIELLPAVKSVVSGRLFVGNSPVDGNCILEA
jgi:DNA-binding NarL/FixJ family response regulator